MHTGCAILTHFSGHNLSVHTTHTNHSWSHQNGNCSRVNPTAPHSTHCTLHACTPFSAAGHMTTLLDGRSLVWLVGSLAGDTPHFTHPLQIGGHNKGGDHLTPALRGPHPLEWTSTGEHPMVTTGLQQSVIDTNPSYSLSECDPRFVYTLLCYTVVGHLQDWAT